MTESLQDSQELLNPEVQELSNLKKEINSSRKHENNEEERKESPYKEMIEKQGIPLSRWNRSNPERSRAFDWWIPVSLR